MKTETNCRINKMDTLKRLKNHIKNKSSKELRDDFLSVTKNCKIKRTFTFKKYENQIKLQRKFKKCVVFGKIDLSLYKIHSYELGTHLANGKHLTFDNFDFVSFICESRHPITKVNYTKFACSINKKVVIVNAVKLCN